MRRAVAYGLGGTMITASLLSVPAAQAAGPPAGSCRQVRVPIALTPGGARDQSLAGTLCTPPGGAASGRVDVLVHGGTYNAAYWDASVGAGRYSYVDKTLAAGRSTFAYDRVGVGASSRPPSLKVTMDTDVYALHQAIQWLRGRDYRDVTVVGHSLGTIIAISEAAAYNDLDRLVATGIAHLPGGGVNLPLIIAGVHPAPLDRRFAGAVGDLGYLTTRPGMRAVFYHAPTADPAVMAYDEAHKDLVPTLQVPDAATRLAAPPGLNDTSRVRVPVVVVLGRHDRVFCELLLDCVPAKVRANEAPYYGSAPSLSVRTVPGTGHSLTLHPSAGRSFRAIDQWIRTH